MKSVLSFIIFFFVFANATYGQNNSMFIFKEFGPAKIYFRNKSITAAPMNYNAENGRMYFMQNSDIMELTNSQEIDSVVWNPTRKFIVYEGKFLHEVKLNNGTAFINWRLKDVNVGTRGAHGVTTQARVVTVHPKSTGYFDLDEEIADDNLYERKNDNTYYIRVNSKVEKVKTLKQLLKLFPAHKDEIQSYAKKEKIDMKNAADAVQLINYALSK